MKKNKCIYRKRIDKNMNRVYKYFLKKYIFEQKIYFMLVLFTVIIQSLIT
ncbi:hypothetical protein CLONEX_03457, partial [[Clostridium] nexile DSM 1787]